MATNYLYTQRRGTHNVYVRVDVDNNGQEIKRIEAEFRIITVKRSDGSTGFVLLDGNGKSNPYFHRYINTRMVENGRSLNSRRTAAGVIGRMFAFLSLMGYSLHTLGQNEVYQLREFLKGTGRTSCSNETVNTYLSFIREFLKANGIVSETLSAQHDVYGKNPLGNDFRVGNVYHAYDINLPTNPHKDDHVPKYISMALYERLVEIARSHGDWTAIILMHLMFRYGMRIGECLGLTEEDLTYMMVDGQKTATLILRNRLSDATYQRAKRKITPKRPSDYESKDYYDQWHDDYYSHYYLTESTDFVQALEKFISETRRNAEATHPKNYATAEADIVHPSSFREKGLATNHYIFLNSLGRRLTGVSWGRTLRDYFTEAGIAVDIDKKDKNLSHRFRHGFAMMHARFMDPPTPVYELMKMMHHVCISSTMKYYNPTLEDEVEYKNRMQNKFFDARPELNAVLDEFLKIDFTHVD